MENMRILWMNLTGSPGTPALCEKLARYCRVRACDDAGAFAQSLSGAMPDIICFDFADPDPDADARALVQKIKLDHPSIPLLMFTTSQSAELVIWAMRTRVWDCFIKPVSCGEVMRRLTILLPVLSARHVDDVRALLMPERAPFSGNKAGMGKAAVSRTAVVLPFLNQHFHEKIALSEAARLCGMDSFEFSRCFRREQGITFRDYLMRLRIEAAARRLRRDNQSVLDIACSLGFNDPSHFARLFRRHMGITPRDYRSTTTPPCVSAACGVT
ncbi:MAG: DNA-binding response regulator [Thiogranum sp.]|nr:DNA-binding response regulator [Thiogranum sp.]